MVKEERERKRQQKEQDDVNSEKQMKYQRLIKKVKGEQDHHRLEQIQLIQCIFMNITKNDDQQIKYERITKLYFISSSIRNKSFMLYQDFFNLSGVFMILSFLILQQKYSSNSQRIYLQLSLRKGFLYQMQYSEIKKLDIFNTIVISQKHFRYYFNSYFNAKIGRYFAEILEREYQKICEILKQYYTPEESSEDEGESKKRVDLVNFLIQQNIIVKVESTNSTSKLKTSDRYAACKEQKVDSDKQILDGTFIFNPHVHIQPKSNYFYMILILVGIALIILFPVWPMSLKRLLFYISVVLLFAIIGLIIVRTFIYFLVRVFGYDFYLFPNLFADVGFFDSFKPLVGYEKCNDSSWEIIMRVVGFFVMGYLIYVLSVERYTVKKFSQQTFDDVLEWGYLKLENVQAPPPKSIEQIINEFDQDIQSGAADGEQQAEDQF